MKKITITTLILLTLFLTGCFIKPQFPVNENQNVNTSTEEIDTSDWKTYRNEEYGFEFKYPRELITRLNEASGRIWDDHLRWNKDVDFLLDVRDPISNNDYFCHGGGPGDLIEGFSIKFIISNTEPDGFEGIKEKCRMNAEVSSGCLSHLEIINGNNYLIIDNSMRPCGHFPKAYFIRDDNEYTIESIWYNKRRDDSYFKNIFLKIISTLQYD